MFLQDPTRKRVGNHTKSKGVTKSSNRREKRNVQGNIFSLVSSLSCWVAQKAVRCEIVKKNREVLKGGLECLILRQGEK